MNHLFNDRLWILKKNLIISESTVGDIVFMDKMYKYVSKIISQVLLSVGDWSDAK